MAWHPHIAHHPSRASAFPLQHASGPRMTAVRLLIALGLGACLLLENAVALAHVGLPGPRSETITSGEPESMLLAKRRRRKRRRSAKRRRKRDTKAVQGPAGQDEEAFPEREDNSSGQAAPPAAAGSALRRGARVEFDGRLVQGQTAKSGAIYLFARRRSELRSMVKERKKYRQEILRTVYPKDEYEHADR